MSDDVKRKPASRTGKAGGRKPSRPPAAPAPPVAKSNGPQEPAEESLLKRLTNLPGAMADSAMRIVARTTDMPLRVGKALFLKPEQAEMMKEAGHTLKDLREVAGLTRAELSDALDLKDHSLIEAVENGTAILSFELILRLAAVLARHDPVPVILRFTRSYNPELWKILEDWGLGRLSLHFERERHFINIYRRHDAARQLSDEGFEKVLAFTRTAFEMALHFVTEQEKITDQIVEPVEPETLK
jgi:transcriptional regulator with XRE-family HTH domain